MRRAAVALAPTVLLLSLGAGRAIAGSLEQNEALAWLQRIANAARQLNYSGTFVYQHGDRVETSRITHYVDRSGKEYEKLETLDGPKREIIRSDDEILSFDAEHKIVRREKRVPRKMFPALLPEQLSSLTEYYRLRKAGDERIAGFDSQALVLEPRDQFRYGHKLWAEASTGLLLKARMLDESNHLVEQFVFTQLVLNDGITRDSVRPSSNAKDWLWEPLGEETAKAADTGWMVATQPAGFRKVMEMERSKAGSRAPVAHLVFSDGLAAVSVFIEPVQAAHRYQEGLAHQGAVNIYTRRLSDQLVTVLGEAPAATVIEMANSVGHKGQ